MRVAHEVVAAAISWTLFTLGTEPAIQTRLRTELESLANDNPTADELNSLTYLDHVVRESLRFHSMFSAHERMAAVDDRIPCEAPYQDRHGNMQTEILWVAFPFCVICEINIHGYIGFLKETTFGYRSILSIILKASGGLTQTYSSKRIPSPKAKPD